MTMIKFCSVIFSIFSLIPNVHGAELDPEYKDSDIETIYEFVQKQGAITLDSRTAGLSVTHWSFEIELVELEGNKTSEVNAAWEDFLEKEKSAILSRLADYDLDISKITEKSVSEANNDENFLFYKEGNNRADIKEWILEELLTAVAKKNLESVFEDGSFDLIQYHRDSTGAEPEGDSLLLVRGVKNVLVIRNHFYYE